MGSGFRGAFVIAWDQSETDGIAGAPPEMLDVGTLWRWHGQALRIDGRGDLLRLEDPRERAEMQMRAAGQVRRLLGPAGRSTPDVTGGAQEDALFHAGFVLTDGRDSFQATMIRPGDGRRPMILFAEALPEPGRAHWVLSCTLGRDPAAEAVPATVCFVPGTRIETPRGAVPVEELGEGDAVCTRDGDPQPVRWIGRRRISGGRLRAMPHLRPVRLSARALAPGAPDADLVVSPDHRVLVCGAVAEALFNTPEVLVAARDLVNDRSIRIDRACRSVDYVHLLLDSHQIIRANGLEVDSFHPAGADIGQLDAVQRRALLERFPRIDSDPWRYGGFARRVLNRAEAALLAHGRGRASP